MGIKISDLQSTIKYSGNELIPIVQNNATRKGTLNSLIPFLSVNSSLNDVNGLKALSGNWQKAYTVSTAYQTSSATFATNSLVQSTSALLLTRSDYNTSSATFAPITIVGSSSANWNSTYAIISTLSSSHGPTGLSGSVVFSTSKTLTADSGLVYTGIGSNGVLRVGGSLNLGTSGLNTSIIQTATGSSKTITLPNATGTVPVYTGTPLSGQVLTSSGTTGAAVWANAAGAPLANPTFTGEAVINTTGDTKKSLVINSTSVGVGQEAYGLVINKSGAVSTGLQVNGTGIESGIVSDVSGPETIGIGSTAMGSGAKAVSLYVSGDDCVGLKVLADNEFAKGIDTKAFGAESIGALITTTTGYYHAKFGDIGIDQSFVARVKGAFGWFRNDSRTARIHPPDTITADRTYTLPDATGTVALTDGSVAQTFTGQLESTNSVIKLTSLPVHNSEAAALTASLSAGQIYRTSTGELRIKL